MGLVALRRGVKYRSIVDDSFHDRRGHNIGAGIGTIRKRFQTGNDSKLMGSVVRLTMVGTKAVQRPSVVISISVGILVLWVATAIFAQSSLSGDQNLPSVGPTVQADGTIVVDGHVFSSWLDYVMSEHFRHCGARLPANTPGPLSGPGDCSIDFTNPADEYDPSVALYRIPVVVHVIQNTRGDGFIGEDRVRSQIDIFNENFLALANTPGAAGTDIQVEFYLATEDPDGNPTNGITYTTNDRWFQDVGNY